MKNVTRWCLPLLLSTSQLSNGMSAEIVEDGILANNDFSEKTKSFENQPAQFSKSASQKSLRLNVDCSNDPTALQLAIDSAPGFLSSTLEVTGECSPITLTNDNINIVGFENASIVSGEMLRDEPDLKGKSPLVFINGARNISISNMVLNNGDGSVSDFGLVVQKGGAVTLNDIAQIGDAQEAIFASGQVNIELNGDQRYNSSFLLESASLSADNGSVNVGGLNIKKGSQISSLGEMTVAGYFYSSDMSVSDFSGARLFSFTTTAGDPSSVIAAVNSTMIFAKASINGLMASRNQGMIQIVPSTNTDSTPREFNQVGDIQIILNSAIDYAEDFAPGTMIVNLAQGESSSFTMGGGSLFGFIDFQGSSVNFPLLNCLSGVQVIQNYLNDVTGTTCL